jgi:hypothetical protein
VGNLKRSVIRYSACMGLSKLIHTAEMCLFDVDLDEVRYKVRKVEHSMFKILDDFYYTTSNIR